MPWQAVLAAFLAAACMVSAGARAAPADARRGELADLKARITALQNEIARGEESHHEVADELADADRAISAAQRKLRDIAARRIELEQQLLAQQAEKTRLESELAGLKARLGEAVFRMYVEGGQGGTRRFLSGDDPNQLARDAHYLEQIARQRMQAIEQARQTMARLEALAAETARQRDALAAIEQERRGEQQSLLAEKEQQRAVLSRISAQLSEQRGEMRTLQRNEERMEKLIQGLEKIARQQAEARARADAQARAEAESRARQAEQHRSQAAASAPSRSDSTASADPAGGQASRLADPGTSGTAFASLKGRLGWPVRGAIKGRFGSPRAGGVTNWHGVFIKAESGVEVRAVAAGKVVFADWLRGFGNVVILDHGDGYMTVYGNNDSLLRNPGDTVRTAEALATVGSSGGQDESGLYFEIRHRGQPQDPAKWMAAK